MSNKHKKTKTADLVSLNIGGHMFTTTIDTLTQNIVGENKESQPHYFQNLFKQQLQIETDEEGNIFIDRDGTHFRHILNYLRKGGDMKLAVFPVNDYLAMEELLTEAQYYSLTHLLEYFRKPYRAAFATPETKEGVSISHDLRCISMTNMNKSLTLRTAQPIVVNKGVITQRIAHQFNSIMFSCKVDAKVRVQNVDTNEVAFSISYIASFNNYIRVQIWLDVPNDRIYWQYTDVDLNTTMFSDYLPYLDVNGKWFFTICDIVSFGFGTIEASPTGKRVPSE